MPAHTVQQLESLLRTGEFTYFAQGGNFLGAMRQVYPRLVDMGLWRDMAYEISLSGQYGYVSLPGDTDAVLACTINNFPRNTRSQWHDIRLTGRQATLSGYYGIVDDGYHPVLLDMKDVQGTDEVEAVTQLDAYLHGTTTPVSMDDEYLGRIALVGKTAAGRAATLEQSYSGDLILTADPGITSITSITYDEVPADFDLVDPDFPDKIIATVPTGSGVLRFRRFRTSNKDANCTVHLLVKRGAPSHMTESTVLHLGNLGALKHGLMGLIAEDDADLERANFHWGMAGKLLDQELASIFGSAKPTIKIHDPAAGNVYNQY